jgi:hypothetical protein
MSIPAFLQTNTVVSLLTFPNIVFVFCSYINWLATHFSDLNTEFLLLLIRSTLTLFPQHRAVLPRSSSFAMFEFLMLKKVTHSHIRKLSGFLDCLVLHKTARISHDNVWFSFGWTADETRAWCRSKQTRLSSQQTAAGREVIRICSFPWRYVICFLSLH